MIDEGQEHEEGETQGGGGDEGGGGGEAQSEHSSHSSSFATSSMTSGGNSLLHSHINPVFDAVRQFSYTTQRRTLPLQWLLDFIIHTAVILQMFSFTLDPFLFYSTESDRSSSFKDDRVSVPMKLLWVLKSLRGATEPSMAWAIIASSFTIIMKLLTVFQMILIMNGRMGIKALFMINKFNNQLIPFTSLLVLNAILIWIQQPQQDAVMIIVSVLCGIAFIALMFNWFLHSVLFVVFITSSSSILIFHSLTYCCCFFFSHLKTVEVMFVHHGTVMQCHNQGSDI